MPCVRDKHFLFVCIKIISFCYINSFLVVLCRLGIVFWIIDLISGNHIASKDYTCIIKELF